MNHEKLCQEVMEQLLDAFEDEASSWGLSRTDLIELLQRREVVDAGKQLQRRTRIDEIKATGEFPVGLYLNHEEMIDVLSSRTDWSKTAYVFARSRMRIGSDWKFVQVHFAAKGINIP